MRQLVRRAGDKGWLCWLAARCSDAWDWIDKRQIDAYAISLAILYGTVIITGWAMDFVDAHPEVDGMKAAAVIVAIMGPWSALQAVAIKFLFEARSRSFYNTNEPAQAITTTATAKVSTK